MIRQCDGTVTLSHFSHVCEIGKPFKNFHALYFIPPEILDLYYSGNKKLACQSSSKGDVWALGVAFYRLLLRGYPYSARNTRQLHHEYKNQQLIIPSGMMSSTLQHVLERMLERNPDSRPTAEELIQLVN